MIILCTKIKELQIIRFKIIKISFVWIRWWGYWWNIEVNNINLFFLLYTKLLILISVNMFSSTVHLLNSILVRNKEKINTVRINKIISMLINLCKIIKILQKFWKNRKQMKKIYTKN